MNRIALLLAVAFITLFIVVWVKRPDIISDFWLWLIGLAGPVIGLFKRILQKIGDSKWVSSFFKPSETKK
jgi:hypothetical protein